MTAAADTRSAEYRALTEACGLVDRSERGKLALTGSERKVFLQGQVTNDVERLEPGHGCYAAFLTHKGKMLGDMRVLDFGDELLLDTERVELHKRTVELGLLSLIGPDARRIAGASDLAHEHDNRRAQVGGRDVVLVATDAGVDVFCQAADTGAVRAALEAAGAVAVSEDAAEVLRVERGRPRFGADIDDGVIPQEAGLNERAVSFTKGCYVGQETVARLFYRGKPNRHLRGLRLSGPAAHGDVLRLGEKEVGRLGSVVVSPAHGPIALAIVRREAQVGDTLAAGDGGATAEVVDLPFRDLPLAG
jgi:tRNA-modifying protein YgfZ